MPFASDTMGHPVIDSAQAAAVAVGMNEFKGYEQRDRVVDPEGGFAKPMTFPKLSRQEIRERFEEQERKKTRLYDLLQQEKIPAPYQYRFSNCWANGSKDAIAVAEFLMGRPFVSLSATSASALIKNGRDVGGWGIELLKFAAEHGLAEEKYWPNNSIDRRKYDTAESRASRETHKIDPNGWIDVPKGDWDAVLTCTAIKFPGCFAFMEVQHLMGSIVAGGIAKNGEFMVLTRNSGYLRDSTGHTWIKESIGDVDEALFVQTVLGG